MTMRTMLRAGAVLAALAAVTPAAAQRQVNARTPTGSTGTLTVELHAGAVRVVGWDRDEVQVTGTLASANDRLELEGGRSGVEVSIDNRGGGRSGVASLEIRVPSGKSVDVTTGAGAVRVSGIAGRVDVTALNGAVTVEGSPRGIDVTSNNGAISINAVTQSVSATAMNGAITVAGTVRGTLEVEALTGAVVISARAERMDVSALSGAVRISNAAGEMDVTSVSGGVAVAGSSIQGNIESVSGNVTIDGALGGGLTIESHSGTVEMRLPGSTSAAVTAEMYSGSFRSDFGAARRDEEERHLRIGSGRNEVSITTFSGDVRILRKP